MFGFSFEVVFASMIAIAVFLLLQAFIVPTFGENGQARKRMKARLRDLGGEGTTVAKNSLLREKYLTQLPPWQRWLESLPMLAKLGGVIEQAGREEPAHRILLKCLVAGAVTMVLMVFFTQKLGLAAVLGLVAAGTPLLLLFKQRNDRLALFEEQLPDALSTMSRALKAGYPFSETLKLVAEELNDPVAKEFELTFNDVNYGGDLKAALGGLLSRIPSVTVMAFVSAVSTQKDTGGNLAELFDKLERVIRGRYKFSRTMRTLTAENRMAAWIMSLFPFVIGGIMSVINPDLMPMLIYDPTGQKLVIVAFVLMIVGILWMQRIVRIDV
jgi:tight adherence protein B